MTTLNGVFLRLLHFVFCVFVEFMKNVQQFEGITLFFCTNKVLKDKLAKNLSYFCTVWSVSLQKSEKTGRIEDRRKSDSPTKLSTADGQFPKPLKSLRNRTKKLSKDQIYMALPLIHLLFTEAPSVMVSVEG